MKKIMIVEDDEVIKDELSELLKNSSYLVESVKNFEKAKEEIFKYNPDLILLDINIPYLNGELLLKEIRKESSVPVIMVTSKSGEIDEALSITYGADDYITKPYNPTILLLRIQNIFKRINQNNNALKYKDIIVDLNKSELKKDDKVLVLTKNEMIIFSYLLNNKEKIVSRDELMTYLWNNEEYINDNAYKKPVKVDKRIIELLTYGKKAYKITNGYVNIAMGSVLSIWHDYREKGESLPPKSMLTKASEHTDINNLIIDKENSTIFFNDKELKLDVGAITKGFVCNKIYEYITQNNLWQSAVISLGGNIITIGNKPDKNDFVIGIENPNSNEYLDKIYADDNTSVVTSGSYQRYYTVDGKDYCHIIDKNTLYPANYFKSVTVISRDSALADTLSTALFCMDLNAGRKLAEKYNIQAIWLDKNDKITKTNGVKSAK